MDPGYSVRHRATRRGLRVVLDLTATGGGAALVRAAGRAVEEIRELLMVPPDPEVRKRGGRFIREPE